jgi:hypothetical protein
MNLPNVTVRLAHLIRIPIKHYTNSLRVRSVVIGIRTGSCSLRFSNQITGIGIIGFALLLAFTGGVSAQTITPRAIVVTPDGGQSQQFTVGVSLSGFSGVNARSYRVDEAVQVSVSPTLDAYIYLFSIDASGFVQLILPNRFDSAGRDNFVRAGQTAYFPPPGASYSFTISPPVGPSLLVAVASVYPLRESVLERFASYAGGVAFAQSAIGEATFARLLADLDAGAFDQSARAIVITPAQPDTAPYAVGVVRYATSFR